MVGRYFLCIDYNDVVAVFFLKRAEPSYAEKRDKARFLADASCVIHGIICAAASLAIPKRRYERRIIDHISIAIEITAHRIRFIYKCHLMNTAKHVVIQLFYQHRCIFAPVREKAQPPQRACRPCSAHGPQHRDRHRAPCPL